MPCGDITEVLCIELDEHDHLRDYSLNKRTCGAPIGVSSLLAAAVRGSSIDQVLALEHASVLEHFTPPDDEEFLFAKHLLALQQGLRVLTGQASAKHDGVCTPTEVVAHDGGVSFRGLVAIDAVTKRIKACGNCGRCGA